MEEDGNRSSGTKYDGSRRVGDVDRRESVLYCYRGRENVEERELSSVNDTVLEVVRRFRHGYDDP